MEKGRFPSMAGPEIAHDRKEISGQSDRLVKGDRPGQCYDPEDDLRASILR